MSLADVAELVRRETGITLATTKQYALRAALHRAAPELEPDTFLRATADPLRGRKLVERLIDEVTVKETAFVRDRGQLDAIFWPGVLDRARAEGADKIRVWSAGCATGEEAYTLALLAAEAFAPADPPVDVLGTDVSCAAITAATAGCYRERAIGGLGTTLRERYFQRQADGRYLVGGRLRRRVRFRRHNLIRDPAPPPGEAGFDIITCRNVLIYFEVPAAARVIEQLDRSLRPGGKLLLGAADTLQHAVRITSPAGPSRAARETRRPEGDPVPQREQRLTAALAAASRGDRDDALAAVSALLRQNPLDADAQFVYGLVTLEAGEPARAAAAFRRALYADPRFALAAFTLGCARDALGENMAARRAYEQTLRMLDPDDGRHEVLLQQIDIGDIAAACRARLIRHEERS
jgi:chemotaxis methyl-accepting protein methylase